MSPKLSPHPPSTTPTPVASLPGLRAWTTAVGAGLSLLLLFAALLVSLRLEKALNDLVEARATLVAQQVADTVEAGLRFGVTLADQTEAPRKMKALAQNDPELRQVLVLDERGRALVRQAAAGQSHDPEAHQVLRLLARKAGASSEPVRKIWCEGKHIHVLLQVRDASGLASGVVAVTYSLLGPQTAFLDSLTRLGSWALVLAAGVTALLSALLLRLSRTVGDELAALQRSPLPSVRWPWLPVPQALGTLARLEAELSQLGPIDGREKQA